MSRPYKEYQVAWSGYSRALTGVKQCSLHIRRMNNLPHTLHLIVRKEGKEAQLSLYGGILQEDWIEKSKNTIKDEICVDFEYDGEGSLGNLVTVKVGSREKLGGTELFGQATLSVFKGILEYDPNVLGPEDDYPDW